MLATGAISRVKLKRLFCPARSSRSLGSSLQRNDAGVWLCEYPGLSFQRSPVCACSLVSSLLLSGATMSQQPSLTQSAHSVRQVLTAYTPGLYFGSTKVNNDFTIVDKVKAEAGGTATLFVKSGDDYVRVSTNVPGSVQGRALGTVLDPKGKAIVNINKGEAFYGEVDILGKPYVTGYDPIKDASGKEIGIWYVAYEKYEFS